MGAHRLASLKNRRPRRDWFRFVETYHMWYWHDEDSRLLITRDQFELLRRTALTENEQQLWFRWAQRSHMITEGKRGGQELDAAAEEVEEKMSAALVAIRTEQPLDFRTAFVDPSFNGEEVQINFNQ